jgi:hypothetical protein
MKYNMFISACKFSHRNFYQSSQFMRAFLESIACTRITYTTSYVHHPLREASEYFDRVLKQQFWMDAVDAVYLTDCCCSVTAAGNSTRSDFIKPTYHKCNNIYINKRFYVCLFLIHTYVKSITAQFN